MSNDVSVEAIQQLGPAFTDINRLYFTIIKNLDALLRGSALPEVAKADVITFRTGVEDLRMVGGLVFKLCPDIQLRPTDSPQNARYIAGSCNHYSTHYQRSFYEHLS